MGFGISTGFRSVDSYEFLFAPQSIIYMSKLICRFQKLSRNEIFQY